MTAYLFNSSGGPVGTQTDPFVNPPFLVWQRAPTTNDIYNPGTRIQDNSVTPHIIYETTGGGQWFTGEGNHATTTTYGTVILTDNTEPVATKAYADALVIAGAPVATTTTSGIGKLVTDANAVARIPSTGLQAYFVQPSNLTAVMSAPGPIGDTTPSTGAFTGLSTDGTAAVTLEANATSDFTVTGAGVDLTIKSTSGSLVLEADEAVTDAITLLSIAGGLDIDMADTIDITTTENTAGAISISTSGGIDIAAIGGPAKDVNILNSAGSIRLVAGESATDSIYIESTIGGIDIFAVGASAGEDINITATGSSVNLSSTENAALAIYLHANGGTSETIKVYADQGTGDASVQLLSDVGGVTLTGGKAAATAINLTASDAAGGITMTTGTGGILPTTTGKFTVVSTSNTAQAIELHANGGTSETIRLRADQGTAATSLDILSDVGGITLNAGLGSAAAINITSSAAGGGWTLNSGTAGVTLTNTGKISLAAAAASDITVTGAFDLTLATTLGRAILQSGKAAADAVKLNATNAAGGITAVAGTGGVTLTNTGGLSLAAAAASNITVTGAFDLTLATTAGRAILQSGKAAADAVKLNATDVAGGITSVAGTGGFTLTNTGALSLAAAAASNITVTGAFDLTLQSTAGAVNIISGEANADSINVTSGGGMSIVATGAAAKDILITNTNGSMTLTAGESVTDAMNFTASGAASGINLTAGTNGILLSSGQKCKVTAVAAAASPYTLLGTDYFVACDVTGGVLTITLPAAPATGRYVIVSDSVGQSGANTITIDGNGKNISLAGTAAGTKTITTAYKAVGLIYNGTIWNGFALA